MLLAKAHEALIVAKANNDEADAMFLDWEAKNPKPASKRGTRKWLKGDALPLSVTAPWWQAMMEAEKPSPRPRRSRQRLIAGAADVQALIACSAIYDEVELNRHNRADGARGRSGILPARKGGAVMSTTDISEEAKQALANVAQRKASNRLLRDGCGTDAAMKRRVLALAAERNLPPADYAKLMHKRVMDR